MEGKEQEKIERKTRTAFTDYSQFFHRVCVVHFSRKTACFLRPGGEEFFYGCVFASSSSSFHDLCDGFGHARPPGVLLGKSSRSLVRQSIELGTPPMFGKSRFDCEPLS